jgi:hypothetical protein
MVSDERVGGGSVQPAAAGQVIDTSVEGITHAGRDPVADGSTEPGLLAVDELAREIRLGR